MSAFLMHARGLGAEEAVAVVAARREINVTPALMELLYKLEAECWT